MTGLMAGKRGLIMGLANDRSLAWGIAKQLGDQGAELAWLDFDIKTVQDLGVRPSRVGEVDVGELNARRTTIEQMDWLRLSDGFHVLVFRTVRDVRVRDMCPHAI